MLKLNVSKDILYIKLQKMMTIGARVSGATVTKVAEMFHVSKATINEKIPNAWHRCLEMQQ